MSPTDFFKPTPLSKVKDLIHVLRDSQMGFRRAADGVRSPEIKELFKQFSRQRSDFAHELQAQLPFLNSDSYQPQADPKTGTSKRAWTDQGRALVNGDYSVLLEAEHMEIILKQAYSDTLESHFPVNVRRIIVGQEAQLQLAYDEIKVIRSKQKLEP
jgi:uncharacterized protein (TIGR02284 family)